MSKEYTLKFMTNQGTGDLFKNVDSGQIFIRMPLRTLNTVQWATTSRWQGGFEADIPVQSGTKMFIVDEKGKFLFEEAIVNDTKDPEIRYAAKMNLFSYEEEKELSQKFAQDHSLKTYDEWKGVMLEDFSKSEYQGYAENWLYHETECLEIETVQKVKSLGRTLEICKERYRHNFSNRVWDCYVLRDNRSFSNLAICGYGWN